MFGYDLLGLIGLIILALVIVFVIRMILILIPAAIVAFVYGLSQMETFG